MNKSDVLTVTYDYNDMTDVPTLCVARHTGDTIKVLKTVIGDQADTLYRLLSGDTEDDGVLQELPQYHFDRDAFVSTFEQVFTNDEIFDLEIMCVKHTTLNEFLLYYHCDLEEFYIIHLSSGTIVNWYKHLGRTNTCNKENFSIADLKNLLEKLKADIKEKNNG